MMLSNYYWIMLMKMAKDVKQIISEVNKDYGGVIMPLDDLPPVETIPFGIPGIDMASGRGGVPCPGITEIYGAESTCKSSLCLSLVSEAQKLGHKCAYIDMEFAMTKDLAKIMDVDLTSLIYAQPTTGEEALTLIDSLIDAGIKVIIVDSVSSMVPEDELDAGFDKDSVGLQARMMSKAMRKLVAKVNENKTVLVFINQIRDDIAKFGFGPKTTTSGGKALRFYSKLRVEMARTGWEKKGEEKIGMTLKATLKKNKIDTPWREAEFSFYFASGFDRDGSLLTMLEKNNTIKKSGGKYYHDGNPIGNKEEAILYLKEHAKDSFKK